MLMLSLVAAMAITSEFLLGLLWLSSCCVMFNSLLETLCLVFAAEALALEVPAVQEAKQSVFFNVCPESRVCHGEKKERKKELYQFRFHILLWRLR